MDHVVKMTVPQKTLTMYERGKHTNWARDTEELTDLRIIVALNCCC